MASLSRRMPLMRLGVVSEDGRRIDAVSCREMPLSIIFPSLTPYGMGEVVGRIVAVEREGADVWAVCEFDRLVDPALQLCADTDGQPTFEGGIFVMPEATLLAATLCERSAFIWPDMVMVS